MTLLEACIEVVSRSWISREYRRQNHRKMEMLPLDVGNVLLEDVVKRHGKRLSPAMIAAFKECASRIALDGWGASHGGGQWLAEIAQYRHLTSLKMNNCSLSHKAKSNYLYLLEGLADKLITLHLQRCGCFTQSALHHISQCHKLQDLDLSGTSMCLPDSHTLSEALTCFTSLTSLALGDLRAVNNACCGSISTLTHLRVLALAGCDSITDTGVFKLAALTGLTSLDISWTSATRPPKIQGLRDLSMNHCTLAGTEDDQGGTSHWPLIERLDLRGADINNRRNGWELLHSLANVWGSVKPLVHLDMGNTDMLDFEFLQGCSNITMLNLSGTKITDVSLICLAWLSELTNLLLSHTLITSQGLKHLAALPNLKVLALASTRIGNSSFVHLARMPSLTDVDMSDNAIWSTIHPTASNQSDVELAAMVALDRLFDRQQSFHSEVEGEIDIAGMFVENLDADFEAQELNRVPSKSYEVASGSCTVAAPHLKRLNLMNTRWTDWGVAQLVSYSPGLVALAVGNDALGNGAIRAIQGLVELETFELKGGIITMDGLEGLESCGKLRTVKVTCTWRELLNDEQLLHLYDRVPALEDLYMNGLLLKRQRKASENSTGVCPEPCFEVAYDANVCRRYSMDLLMRSKLRLARKMAAGDSEEMRIVADLRGALLPDVRAAAGQSGNAQQHCSTQRCGCLC